MEDHVARILKMLEEGKITAEDAQKLIAALAAHRPMGPPPPPHAPGRPPEPPPHGPGRPEGPPEPPGSVKNFEFPWGGRPGGPFDLADLGRQISEAVSKTLKRVDPERFFRERGPRVRRPWPPRHAFWGFAGAEGPERPDNLRDLPSATADDTLTFAVTPDATIRVENQFGDVRIVGTPAQEGASEQVTIQLHKVAWAASREEAQAALTHIQVMVSPTDGGPASHLEIHVQAPEGWREGTADLLVHVPSQATVDGNTTFGEVRAEAVGGNVGVRTAGGSVFVEEIGGSVNITSVTGDIEARGVSQPANISTKSGSIHAEDLRRGATLSSVSGDVHAALVEGGALEARSVSGDVRVEEAGVQTPVDLRIETVSGDIRMDHAHGNVNVRTVSGDVTAERLEVGTLACQTVSGDVRLHLDHPFSGSFTTTTVSGDVTVRMPAQSHFRFSLTTASGDITCDHPAAELNKTPNSSTGVVGTGAGQVLIQTRSGDVRLLQAHG
ncbi:MAG: DUF4097 family beta strand repeat-containing protein [Chthonomonadales bacterium]